MNRSTPARRVRSLILAIIFLAVGVAVAIGASPMGTTGNSPLAGTALQTFLIIGGATLALLGAVIGIRLLAQNAKPSSSRDRT